MKYSVFLFNIFIAVFLQGVFCVVLKDVKVPSMVLLEDDDNQHITLDCEYELGNDENILVLKWVKNNNAVYQWIKGQRPSVFPQFKNKVNPSLQMSTDPEQQYRGLQLIDLSIDTSGTYKCVIQSEKQTVSMEKKLEIIDVRNYTLNIFASTIQNETHLDCVVNNVFPEPQMHFINQNDNNEVSILNSSNETNDIGLYNAKINAVVNSEEADAYACTVTFMGLDLNLTKTVTSGFSSNNSHTICIYSIFLTLFLIFKNNY